MAHMLDKRTNENMQQRIGWVDIVRGIFMLMIVIGHVFFYSDSVIRWYVYSFHVPAFFFVSGYCFRYRNGFKGFIKQRFVRLIVPYLLLSVLFIGVFAISIRFFPSIGRIYTFETLQSVKTVLYSNYNVYPMKYNLPLWFLPCLFFVEILAFCIEKISKSMKNSRICRGLACCISVVASVVFKINLPWHIETSMAMLFWYELGIIIRELNCLNAFRKMKSLLKGGIIVVLLMVGGILPFFNSTNVSVLRNLYGSYPIYYFSCLCSILGYVLLSTEIKSNKMLEFIGKNTMAILAFHKIPIIVVQYFIKPFGKLLDSPESLYSVILGVITTGIAVLFSLIIGQVITIICPVLLGKRKIRLEGK